MRAICLTYGTHMPFSLQPPSISPRRQQRQNWLISGLNLVRITRICSTQGIYLAILFAGLFAQLSETIAFHFSLGFPHKATRPATGTNLILIYDWTIPVTRDPWLSLFKWTQTIGQTGIYLAVIRKFGCSIERGCGFSFSLRHDPLRKTNPIWDPRHQGDINLGCPASLSN